MSLPALLAGSGQPDLLTWTGFANWIVVSDDVAHHNDVDVELSGYRS